MYIDTVTITGADDLVDRNDLYALSDRFPFVEWGILYNSGKEGKPRYPSDEWVEKFDRYAPTFVSRAVHLCGKDATAFCDGDLSAVRDAAYHSPRYDRVQVNIHEFVKRGNEASNEIADLLIRSNDVTPTIVQLNDITRPIVKALSKKDDGDLVQILFDESRGKGTPVMIREDPEKHALLKNNKCGLAGGIGPDNVLEIAKSVAGISNLHYDITLSGYKMSPPSTWIDMESGVRTENVFDLKKVENVLLKMERAMRGDYEK